MDKNSEILTIEELADLLKVSTRTIRRIVKRRELPYIRIGRQLRFRRESIDAWLDSSTIARSEGENSA